VDSVKKGREGVSCFLVGRETDRRVGLGTLMRPVARCRCCRSSRASQGAGSPAVKPLFSVKGIQKIPNPSGCAGLRSGCRKNRHLQSPSILDDALITTPIPRFHPPIFESSKERVQEKHAQRVGGDTTNTHEDARSILISALLETQKGGSSGGQNVFLDRHHRVSTRGFQYIVLYKGSESSSSSICSRVKTG
jgi:hypothetical protein